MQNIDWGAPYSTRKDEKGKTWYCQDGLEYDREGKPLDPKAVQKRANEKAAEIQANADKAMEEAKQAQRDADAQKAEVLGLPADNPETVAELTAALEARGVEIPDGSKKADLVRLWSEANE